MIFESLPISIEPYTEEIVFMNEDSKERLAHIKKIGDNQVISALYKSDESEVKISNVYDESNFFLYPNPTFGIVRLDFVNLPEGAYFFEVYNIIGKKLWSKKFVIRGYTTVKDDLGFLHKGTYLYSLVNSEGKKLFTKRMAIITP